MRNQFVKIAKQSEVDFLPMSACAEEMTRTVIPRLLDQRFAIPI